MMKNTIKKPLRHFPYKHPTFGTEKNPKSEKYWKSSVYYWWWAYLKRNEEYLECCNRGGKGKLSSLYKDFGDVRGDSFKAWWSEGDRGAELFADPPAEESIRILKKGDQYTFSEDVLNISFPMNLPKRFLETRFKEILSEHHKGKRGHQLAKRSSAKYKVSGQPNIPSLEISLKVYDAYLAQPEKPLWKIGNEIPGVIRTQKIKPNDEMYTVLEKKKALAITVSRYIKRVKLNISNTSLGKFP
jgi:hypothetical protein